MRQQARRGSLLGADPEVIGPVQPPDRQAIRCLLSSQKYTARSFEKCAQGNLAGSRVPPVRRERGVLQCHHRDDAHSLSEGLKLNRLEDGTALNRGNRRLLGFWPLGVGLCVVRDILVSFVSFG